MYLRSLGLLPKRCDGFPRWKVHSHSPRMNKYFLLVELVVITVEKSQNLLIQTL